MPEIEKEDKHLMHYDQIGWLITSFFLIFLGTILPMIIKWINNPIDPLISFSTIFLTMFFGFIVARLFLKCQYKRLKKEFFSNFSIWIYSTFIFLIEIFLGLMLYRIGLITLIDSFILVEILLFLFVYLEIINAFRN